MKAIIGGAAAVLMMAIAVTLSPARAQQGPQNNTPLAFGMNEQDAASALGTPLTYISGRPGDEIYLTFRHAGGTGFFNRKDRLYLQFRHGRLAGWKGDWGRNWMWQ